MVISDVDTGEFIAKKIIYDQSVTRVHSVELTPAGYL